MYRRSLPSRASLAVPPSNWMTGANATNGFSGRTASQVWVSNTAPCGVLWNQTASAPRIGNPSIVTTSPWRNESRTRICASFSGAGASGLLGSVIELCCAVLRRCVTCVNERATRRRRPSTELFAFHLVVPGPEQLVGGEWCASHNAFIAGVLPKEGVENTELGL